MPEPVSPDEILIQGKAIKDDLARALYFFTYCTGARIGEAARFQPINLTVHPDKYIVKLPLEKKRDHTRPHIRVVPIPRGGKALCHEEEMMQEVMRYLGSQPANGRQFPFWVWGCGSEIAHGRNRGERRSQRPEYMSCYMLRKSKMKAVVVAKQNEQWVSLLDERPLLCHWLRHCRATHLADPAFYDLDLFEIVKFFDWNKAEMALVYTHLKEKERLFGL